MSRVISPKRPPIGHAGVLETADWDTYSRLLRVFAESPRVRLTYDHGRLEILSPLYEHDGAAAFMGRMVTVLTEQVGLPLKEGMSTTLRRPLRERGIESDECYWIANAHRMAGKRRLDLRTDPPPDLAIEVDGSHSSMNRLAISADLGVPELWQLAGNVLVFYVLGKRGKYAIAEHSRLFPMVRPADLRRFLNQARDADDSNPVIRRFRDWVRKHRTGGQ
jgi:Uma2 family endonuclease